MAAQAARAAAFADELEPGWLEAALKEEWPPPQETLKWFVSRLQPMLEEAPTTTDQALSYKWGRLSATCQARALVHAAQGDSAALAIIEQEIAAITREMCCTHWQVLQASSALVVLPLNNPTLVVKFFVDGDEVETHMRGPVLLEQTMRHWGQGSAGAGTVGINREPQVRCRICVCLSVRPFVCNTILVNLDHVALQTEFPCKGEMLQISVGSGQRTSTVQVLVEIPQRTLMCELEEATKPDEDIGAVRPLLCQLLQ